jgi:hypothetical protein
MRIEPFQPEHMAALLPRLNVDQTLGHEFHTPEFCERLKETSTTYTALTDDGQVLAICGVMQLWPERYHLFAYMSRDSGPYMVSITRGVRRFLDTVRGRLETQVSDGFEAGHRWVGLLGFRCETPEGMDWFFPENRRGFMYSKVAQ